MKALLFIALVAGALPASAQTWSFRVLLDEREIGTHRFTLTERGAERELVSEASFRVTFLGFSAYRYRHEATERWREGCLRSLVSTTDDNGEPYKVDWRARGECVLSFAYWNPKILGQKQLLNAQTGELEPVTVAPLGVDSIETGNGKVSAQRYRIAGRSLAIDLWYAEGKDWVALETTAGDNRRLRYRLEPQQ
jgi:hypothetical protein